MKLTCDWLGGYVGCVRDLVVQGTSVKLGDEARTQDPGSIKQGCQHRWVEVVESATGFHETFLCPEKATMRSFYSLKAPKMLFQQRLLGTFKEEKPLVVFSGHCKSSDDSLTM